MCRVSMMFWRLYFFASSFLPMWMIPSGERNQDIAIPGKNIINEDVLKNDVENRY